MMGYYSGASPANAWKMTKYGVVDIYLSSALIPQNANWHQVTYVYSSTAGVSCYLDGALQGTYTGSDYTNNLSTSTTNVMGQGESGYHSGSIGSIRMWNTALTSTQITQNFSAVRGKYGI
jgi:Tfp pilus assembly protein FimT